MIKISVPNDDSAALFHLGKSLIDLSSTIEGSPYWVVITQEEYDSLKARDSVEIGPITVTQAAPAMMRENDVGGSIGIHGKRKEEATHIITSEEKVGDPVYVGDGNFSQGYRIEVEELATTDSIDTPWDERIHSASKALNADGTWRLRRKPKDQDEGDWLEYVAKVRDELLGQKPDEDALQPPLYEVSPGHIGVMPPEPAITPAGDDFHVDAGVVTEQQVASFPPPPPVPVPAPPVKVYGGDMTFPQVMAYLTERHGRISNAQVEQIIAEMGLKSIMDLNTQPEHTGPFIALVKALLGE